jgi:hypothetical protein
MVGKILVSLHANVDAKTPLMTLVQQSGYYATAYVSLSNAMSITKETQGWIHLAGKAYLCHFVQLLPNIDEETQRAKVRFSIENSPSSLLLGAFVQMDISLAPTKDVVMVKKTALTLYKGDWVVFMEKEHEEVAHHEEKSDHDHEQEKEDHDAHDHSTHKNEGQQEKTHKEETHKEEASEHEGHDHDAHKELAEHEKHDEERQEHDTNGHDEHEDKEEAPYEAKVVKVLAYVGEYVAVKGLGVDVEYVSDGVYFVKSMLLKSSLGGHGH